MGKKRKQKSGGNAAGSKSKKNNKHDDDEEEDAAPRSSNNKGANKKKQKGGRKSKHNHHDNSNCNTEEDNKFRNSLETSGSGRYAIVDMSADGNCLFRALSDQLFRDHGNLHFDVRTAVCGFIQAHEDDFSVFLVLADSDDEDQKEEDEDAADFESYVKAMREDGEWGGNVELMAAARLYERNIQIFSPNTSDAIVVESGAKKSSGPDLLLSYHDNDHYNSVRDSTAKPTLYVGSAHATATAAANVDTIYRNGTKGKGNGRRTKNSNKNSDDNNDNDTTVLEEASIDTTAATATSSTTNGDDNHENIQPPPKNKNDPCPCGSGKKYKKCCLAQQKHDAVRLRKLKRTTSREKANHVTNNNNVKLSKALSWALRHHGPDIGLSMTPDAYVPVIQILECKHKKFASEDGKGWTLEQIQHAVRFSDKQRFQLGWKPMESYPSVRFNNVSSNGDSTNDGLVDKDNCMLLCIRATQGHSLDFINADLLLTPIPKDELATIPVIVHGTYQQPWANAICRQGLKRMTRNHIHFAAGLPHEKDAVISGMRKTCDVYIYINAMKCAQDPSICFYRSNNGVLLTAGVKEEGTIPVEYFSHVTDPKGTILLDQRN